MDKQSIANSFESILDNSSVIVDTGIDLISDDEFTQSIPFVSDVMAVYHIGKTIREKHHLKKLLSFIQEIEAGTIDKEKQKIYITGWHASRETREEELEYLIVIIDRFLHKDMARMLARVYLAYLENQIDWEDVLRFSAVIDRLLPGDYEALQLGDREDVETMYVEDTVLRLVGLGLMVAQGNTGPTPVSGEIIVPHKSNTDYIITDFGSEFLNIIG